MSMEIAANLYLPMHMLVVVRQLPRSGWHNGIS